MINIRASIPSDFINIELTKNGAYPQEIVDQLKSDEYGRWVIDTSKICLTFEQNNDIIGIVGSCEYENGIEIFSYLSQKFCLMFNLKLSRFLQALIKNLTEGYKTALLLVKKDSEVGKRFARFLGFTEDETEDNMVVYKKWLA